MFVNGWEAASSGLPAWLELAVPGRLVVPHQEVCGRSCPNERQLSEGPKTFELRLLVHAFTFPLEVSRAACPAKGRPPWPSSVHYGDPRTLRRRRGCQPASQSGRRARSRARSHSSACRVEKSATATS